MLLHILLFICYSFKPNIKLARRVNDIVFDSHFNSQARSNSDSWYYVSFDFDENPSKRDQMISKLQKQGIQLKSNNCISKNLFNLYLSPDQVNYIIRNKFGKIQEIQKENKLLKNSNTKWSFITIESFNSPEIINDLKSTTFSDKSCYFKFNFVTNSTFSIKSDKKCLISIIPTLTNDNRVFAVSFDNEPEELNCKVAGFSQKNTKSASVTTSNIDGSHIVEISRFLNDQGLDGTGVTVQISDTFLDTNSTFFYDPSNPNFEYDTPIKNHRKISYLNYVSSETASSNEHGTHVAGTLLGKANNEDGSISKYNGIAPGSKLAFYSSLISGFDMDEILKVTEKMKPNISSNSWGREILESTLHDALWDEAANKHKDTLFVFAAGNSGQYSERDGYQTMRSPGSAKNVLTVGAVNAVTVDENTIGSGNREIYLVDDDSKDSHFLKLFEWSVTDYTNNIGLKNLFELGNMKVLLSRTPTEIKNNTVLVIDNQEQFNSISKNNPPYFVISTFADLQVSNFNQLGFKHTFPVMYIKNSSLPQYQSNTLHSNFRTSSGYKRAVFSSKGTGNLGIMKPDIMCPGESVLSAKSLQEGKVNHEELTIKYGTSMATPVCAGAAAIVYQFFADGKYRKTKMEISSSLARSFMITVSDPMSSVYPNADEGFGIVNLGKFIGNGEETDNKRLLVGDHLKISDTHIMSTFSVNKHDSTIDLIITLSYLDPTLSADSSAALAVDIDLVIVSPSGVVYRGNMRADSSEEHYSTNERVIINKSEIENGDYEIHVFSSIPSSLEYLKDDVEFAMTIFGPLNNNKNGNSIHFEKAKKCIPLFNDFSGACNSITTENECNFLRYGRSCQLEAIEYYPDIPRDIITVQPFGLKYINLIFPFFPFNEITYRITPASVFEPKIMVFYNNQEKGGSELESDLITTKNGFESTYYFDMNNPPNSDIYALVVIYNTSPYPTDFIISSQYQLYSSSSSNSKPIIITNTEEPDKTEITETTETIINSENTNGACANGKTDDQWNRDFLIAASLAIVFGFIMIILIIVLIVLLLLKKKRREENSAPVNLHDSLL